ncbi:MAG: cation transporter [Rhodovibrionaceae bacterium]
MKSVPSQLESDLRRAVRLEWWTIAWQLSIVGLLALVLGSSQAMKTAWIEDLLGLVPAFVFLTAIHFERKTPNAKFPFGYDRVNSLAFLVSASTLVIMGGYLLFDSAGKLLAGEHPTLGPVTLLGQQVWIGWLMAAALAYSVVPPLILGRKKLPIARRLSDKVLHTDALMQKADWMTGLAGVCGVFGVGFGFWWADSAAAMVIAFDIVRDGLRSLRIATAELTDGAPRALDSDEIAEDAATLRDALARRYPEGEVRLRETGRYIRADIHGATAPPAEPDLAALWPGDPERAWRFESLSFTP